MEVESTHARQDLSHIHVDRQMHDPMPNFAVGVMPEGCIFMDQMRGRRGSLENWGLGSFDAEGFSGVSIPLMLGQIALELRG